jgi:phosphatidylethanolamine-binding protein (PEBP) family uncharacterized protein
MVRRKTRKQRGGNIDELRFSKNLNVTISNTKAAGQLISKQKTVEPPLVKWPTEEGKLYTLICADPDAVAKSWLHWLVINCENQSPESGTELVKWSPPAPNSGTHRYFFCLFSHAYKISPEAPKEFGYFDVNAFATANGLIPERVAIIKVAAA